MSLSNSLGLLGRKVGMMRLFTDDGDSVPVTVVDVSNNRVTQIKTNENDGYVALQVTFGSRKASRVTKPVAGHLAKAGVEAGEIIQEFRVTADSRCAIRCLVQSCLCCLYLQWVKPWMCKARLLVKALPEPSSVITSSHSAHRTVTAVRTMCLVLSVWLKILVACSLVKRMSGQMGNVTKSIQNLDVVRIDEARQLLLIKGAIPGSKGGFVTVRHAIKTKSAASIAAAAAKGAK